jgi:hypothetical protein
MKRFAIAIICISAISISGFRAAQGWNNIVPLHSTRADVERLLGKPTDPGKKSSAVYELDKEVVLIFFAGGPPCSSSNGWNVMEGTVVDITVTPKRQVMLTDLDSSVETYKKTVDPHDPYHTKYVNEKTGESIIVSDGEVQYLTFSPAAKDNNLKCRSAASSPQARATEQYAHSIDAYGTIPYEDEKLRLDNFAVELQLNLTTRGYVQYYWSNNRKAARMRATRAQRYLVKRHQIDPSRIILREGGRAESFMMMLGLLPDKAHN